MNGEAGGAASGTEHYYSFDYSNIHFICLDSMASSRSAGSPMLTWLQADISSTTKNWIVAFWHHPPYSKGSHDSDAETELIQMRQNALPILESYGVDLVLGGHSHSYERSYLLDGHYGSSSTLTSSMIKDSGDGHDDGDGAYEKPVALTPHKGTVYTVAGTSGQTSGGSLNHPAMYISLNVLGSLVLDLDGSRLDAKFLNSSGSVKDYFTIKKDLGTSTFDFSLTNGGSQSVTRGASVCNTISAALVSGTAQSVAFSASGLPTGASASFSSTSCTPTCSTALTITTAASTPTGPATITVTGSGGGVTRTTRFTLTINALPPPPSNLLLNPGFELDANGDGQPDSWSTSSKFTRSNAMVHSGSFAGKFLLTDNSSSTVNQTVNNLTAGTTYSFSGWVNIPPTIGLSTFRLRVRWLNAS